jgi:hypothetical protein
MSTDGYMKWAATSQPALKAGAFFRTRTQTIPTPDGSVTADDAVESERKGIEVPATVWFPHAEPQLSVREMKLHSEHYELVITLLVLPRVASAWPPWSNERV